MVRKNFSVIAKQKGEVRFSDIAEYFHKFFDKTPARTVLHSGDVASQYYRSLYQYMQWWWNHPKKCLKSPYRYFDKMMLPDRVDEDGNVVYRFNRAKYEDKAK